MWREPAWPAGRSAAGSLLALIGTAAFAVVLGSRPARIGTSHPAISDGVVGSHLERLAGGSISITSPAGQCTTLAVKIPIPSTRQFVPTSVGKASGIWPLPVKGNPCQPVSGMGACCDDMRCKFHHRGAV